MAKKKKEKIIYYDDNSTISDMSAVPGGRKTTGNKMPIEKATFKEKLATYFSAVKMMLLPTVVVLTVLVVLYIIIMFLL